MLVSFDETCFAGNDSSIVDHALSVVRNHTDHAKGYGSALRVFFEIDELKSWNLMAASMRNIYKVFCNKRSKTPIFTRFSAKCPKPTKKLQKHQYLQGFLQKSLKNIKKTQVSAVFTRFSAKSVQKHNYLQGFR